jgi:hypothetical protein
MPRSGMPGGTDGRCPRCGGDLMRIVVLHGGGRERCPACGFARIVESAAPLPPMPAPGGAEPTTLQDTIHMLVYAQAVLQTIQQVRGCRRCGERLALLRNQIDDLEQMHASYVQHPEQCDDQCVDAFFDLLTERLRSIGRPCATCRRRMEDTTWDLFVRLLLASKEQEE